jgi:hypothetical protein
VSVGVLSGARAQSIAAAQMFTETDTSAKPNQNGNLVTCHLDKAKNTFTGPEGTSSLSSDATGFTPAR